MVFWRRIVFDGDERYYEHKVSKVRTKINRIRNEYIVEYDVIPYAHIKDRMPGNGVGHARR